jgi:UDP-N-acetylglucosamine transferase subunit ALG13
MILVTVGASRFPFDRLIAAMEGIAGGEELVVQHGPSPVRPAGARCVEFMAMDEMAACVREARLVITHAGVGSILLCLGNGLRPCVVPRLRAFGETVDDHQLESARRFASAGLVTLVEDPAALAGVIDAPVEPFAHASGEPALVTELRGYIEGVMS